MNGKVILMNFKLYIEIEVKGIGFVLFFLEDWLIVLKVCMFVREVSCFFYIKDIYFEDEKGVSWMFKELEKFIEEFV